MKLPIPFLLYTASLGLCGFAGWEVYKLLPLQKKEFRESSMRQGMKAATDHLSVGARSGPTSVDWTYSQANRAWWLSFDETNFIGKLPPPPPEPTGAGDNVPKEKVEEPVVPLESIIELVSLAYDSKDNGRGELSHVIVRYKPEANVQPPEWYLREAAASTASSPGANPTDRTPPPRRAGGNQDFQGRNNRGGQRPPATQPAPTAMPSSPNSGGDVLQKVWVAGAGDPRRDPHLWPPYENIRLVRVGPTAYSAFFVREQKPPTGEGGDDKQEELFKTTADIDQAMLAELARINGESAPATGNASQAPAAVGSVWEDTPETTWTGNRCNVSQSDEALFGRDDSIFEKAYVDVWVSKSSSLRGLKFKSIDGDLGRKFGITEGDVLLSVNGRAVRSKADAIQFGKQEYNKGVRTFVTVWLANGQEVERIYQAPPSKK